MEADLIGAKLEKSNIDFSNLANTNLTNANLANANLNYTNLTDANLCNTNLTRTRLIGADLTGAILTGANLTNANLIDVNLTNANLANARLENMLIRGANFNRAILNDTFTLDIPLRWSLERLDYELNHFNNYGKSILTSIDNQYSELKIKLVRQLINSIDHPDVNLNYVTLPLLEILSKFPYIKNQEINFFIQKIINKFLKDYSSFLFFIFDQNPSLINAFVNYFTQHPQYMVLPEFNGAFIQTILAARKYAINPADVAKASILYEAYLKMPEIQQQLHHEEINGIFGDYEGNVDWEERDAPNYLLLSPIKSKRELIVSENTLNQMLWPNLDTKWDNIYLFQDGKNLSASEYTLTQC